MKDYTIGIVRHRCSNRMRIGKRVKLYERTSRRQPCPNCGKDIKVKE